MSLKPSHSDHAHSPRRRNPWVGLVCLESLMYPCRFGSYVILQPLGEGGMGRVALALSTEGGRERLCVVKRLHARFLKNAEHLKRFDDEAAISRRLSHANLVDTFAVGQVEGEPFIAQAFVDGRDLSEFVSRTRSQKIQVPLELWIYVVRQVAQGLAYAHDFEKLGLIHRDINPPNIRLGFSGEVKLIDFGLAKWKDKSSETVKGSLLGKTAYIAPEQLKSDPLDRRSDLYVLGVVLWELLAGHLFGTILKNGQPVYADGDRAALARLFSPVTLPPSSFNPSVPDELDSVVLKAVAPKPGDRYQTAAEFGAELAGFLPIRFDPAAKLVELMRLGFASEVETKGRQAMIEAGRALLGTTVEQADKKPTESETAPSQERKPLATASSRTKKVATLILLVALPLGIAVWVVMRPSGRPQATQIVQHQAPAVPAVPVPAAAPVEPLPNAAIKNPQTSPPVEKDKPAALPRVRQTGSVKIPAAEPVPMTSGPTKASLVEKAKNAFVEGNPELALRLANEVLAQGADADAWMVIGNVHFRRRSYVEAQKAYGRALELQPNNEKIKRRLRMAQEVAADVPAGQ
jgi:eukaryotic-like serine/threonine-protein kinase